MFKEGLALAGVYLMVVATLICSFFIARAILLPTDADAFYYDNTDAVDAHATNMANSGGGREYWLRSLVQATSTKFYIYSNWSDSSSNFWNMRRLVLTSPLASSTQVTFNYSVTRRGGSCHAGGGFINSTGFTTASPPDAFTVFTSSSSSASYTLTTSTTTQYVWYGARSRQGQTQDCDIYFTSITADGNQLLTFADSSASGSGGGNIINITDNGMTTSEWTCTTDGDETICEATATSSVRAYDGPTYYEWLLVGGVIIFILLLGTWSRLSILRFKK